MATDVGSAVGYLDLDISGFLAGLRTAQDEANKQTKNIVTKIGDNFTTMGNSLTSVGTTLTKSVTVPITAIGTAGLKVAMDFEKGMSDVKAVANMTGEEFDALRDKAIDLGATTAFSATEVAEAMTEMAKAGWGYKDIMDGMSGVLNATAASGESLATVATIVADALTGFGEGADQAQRYADLLTQAANSGTIGIYELGESFKYIAPVAGSFGFSVEDVTTAITAMSTAGIKGSQAGTSLRSMLTNLVKPSKAIAGTMDALSISATNTDGTMKSLDDIVANLRTSFAGLTEAEKASAAATLAGKEGMSGLLAILNLTEKEYDEIAASMDNASGVALKTAEVMQDNLKSKVEQLGGALESLAIKLGDIVIPYIQSFVEWLTSLVDKFTNLDTETQKMVLIIAGLAAAIGPLLVVFGTLLSSLGTIISTLGKIPAAITTAKNQFTALQVAITGISAPIAAAIAVIALLIAAFVDLWKNNEEFRDKITAIWNQVKETFNNFAQGIVDRLNSLGFEFESITDVLKVVWEGFCEFIAPVFEGAFQIVADLFKLVTDQMLNTLDFWIAIFQGDWEGAWNAAKSSFQSVWEFITSLFETVLDTMKSVLEVVCNWFGTTWEDTWNSVSEFFSNTWDSITSFLTNAWETIKNVVTVGIMFIAELFETAFELITLPFQFIWVNCKETIMSVWNAIEDYITNTLDSIKTFISNVWNGIKAVLDPILNSIKTVITNVWNSVKTNVTNVLNGIKSTVSTVWENVKSVISNVINTIKSNISSGLNSAKSTVSSIFDSIKSKISTVMDSAKTTVKSGIDKLKSYFKFEWSLPKIKLPHFTITGKFSLNPPSVPNFSIEWYSKAMSRGMILNSPTIFGFDPVTGKFLGGGEAGSETIVGTSNLMSMIRNAVNEAVKPMIEATYQLTKASQELGYITNTAFARQTKVFEEIIRNRGNDSSGGGHTFNFYSPEAIDEVEAAHQMKKAMRELAEGF